MSEIGFKTNMYYNYRLFILCFLGVAFGAMDSVLSSAYLPDLVQDLTGQTSAAPPDDPAFYDIIGRQRAAEGYMTRSVLMK